VEEMAVEFLPTSSKAAVVASFILVLICDLKASMMAGKVAIDPVQFLSITKGLGRMEALSR
jgi:hypothetical protein